jgi:SEC-C motif-containing protein
LVYFFLTILGFSLNAQKISLNEAIAVGMEKNFSIRTAKNVEKEAVTNSNADRAQVIFTAHWADPDGTRHQHRERSDFLRQKGQWYFIDPNHRPAISRNTPCLCGSGKKFKRCCGA